MSGSLPAGDAPPALEATGDLRRQLDAVAACVRTPGVAPPPRGISPQRAALYRRLFFGNVSQLLAQAFPVVQQTLGAARWEALADDFYREHDCARPLFTELPREFIDYLETRTARADPPWLHELAHYEWVELALQTTAAVDTIQVDPAGDLLAAAPVVSVLAWTFAYAWPVHRIGPDLQPAERPPAPTQVLLHRNHGGSVRFHLLGALGHRLLLRLDADTQATGLEHLHALAADAGRAGDASIVTAGAALLARWRCLGVVRGTRA